MNLGRLTKVDLRAAWANEAGSFTPWLAKDENLALLSESVGINLSLEAQEKNVGPFRADLLCKEDGTDHWVLVENQIERTDHTHLGQLLTYAAGLNTVTIIWIAQRFTDEHRAALDWLNEVTTESISFFGLEIELWKIGESDLAPKFNVVSKPNAFVKRQIADRTQNTERSNFYQEYWESFAEYLRTHSRIIKPTKTSESWMGLAIGKSGFGLRAVPGKRDRYVLADFAIFNDSDKSIIGKFAERRVEIDTKAPEIEWKEKLGSKESAVQFVKLNEDPSDRSRWLQQHAWMLEKLEFLHMTFAPMVKDLS